MNVRKLFLTAAIMLLLTVPALAGGDEVKGEKIFKVMCVACHGPEGQGGRAPSLVKCHHCGSMEALIKEIAEEMPKGNPTVCADPCAADAAAYIFKKLN